MQKEVEITRPNLGNHRIDRAHPTGFRPLALPAVVAAVKALARRAEAPGPAAAPERRVPGNP